MSSTINNACHNYLSLGPYLFNKWFKTIATGATNKVKITPNFSTKVNRNSEERNNKKGVKNAGKRIFILFSPQCGR